MDNKYKTSALQSDYAFSAVDDYNTRMYILPHLINKEDRDAIIAEHRLHPCGAATQPGKPAPNHSKVLGRLIDKLRVVGQRHKHTIVETIPWQEYTIGYLPGYRGGVIELSEIKYATREDAEHAIFLQRLEALLEQYGIDINTKD